MSFYPSGISADLQSQNKKVGIIKKLLAACQGNEAKFIVRSLEGKLRIGLADKTLVVALAHAIVLKDLGQFTQSSQIRSADCCRGQEYTSRQDCREARARGRYRQIRLQVRHSEPCRARC